MLSGFVLNDSNAGDRSGSSVSSAGDFNGDGFDDIIIGTRSRYVGESYVVFGTSSGFSASLDLSSLDGSNGFVINGIDAGDRSGFSVSNAGDVNGDGFDDILIGALGSFFSYTPLTLMIHSLLTPSLMMRMVALQLTATG